MSWKSKRTPAPRTLPRLLWGLGVGAVVVLSAASTQREVSAVSGPKQHLVKAGETLSEIGKAYGVPVPLLVAANGIEDPNRIRAGQQLTLPVADDPAAPPGEHVVRPGETVSEIALKYGVPVAALAQLNSLANPDKLRSGQRLQIPPSLEDRLERALTSAAQLRVGVAAQHLETGQRASLRGEETFHSASLMKLPIMVEVYAQHHEAGRKPSDTVQSMLHAMIVKSDNRAANQLLEMVTRERVNQRMDGLGLSSTVLYNPFSADGEVPSERFNQTSPGDMLTLLRLLAKEQLVSPTASREMLALLDRTEDNSRLERHLPDSARVAHKSGWFDGVSNDVGVVFSPRGTYLLAVLAEGQFNHEEGSALVGELSRVVYETWGK